MSRLSFVHASDLHLDSPFVGVTATNPAIAARLHSATFDAFDNIIALCVERSVDFVLVAGDVYDGADRSLRAQLRFRDGLARLAAVGIHAFVTHGNHDSLDGWSSAISWPDGVTVFGAELLTMAVQRNGATAASVTGISYPRRHEERNLAALFPSGTRRPDGREAPFRIGLLHANCGRNLEHDPYAPCEVDDLVDRGIDYWALGHVHTQRVLHESPHVVYPGNPQGRHFREAGPRGCILVEVNGPNVVTEFVPTDVVRWETLELDLAPFDTLDALDAAILKVIDNSIETADGRDLIARVRISGRGPLYRDLRRMDYVDQLRDRVREVFAERPRWVWVEAIELDCQPEIDIDMRQRGQDLGGELLRAAADWRAGGLPAALLPALQPLLGSRRVAKILNEPCPNELDRLLREAELLCLDQLDSPE